METPARKTVQALNCPRVQESQNFRNPEPRVLLADEREAVVAMPPNAEPVEIELAAAGVAPQTEDVQEAVRAAPRLVKKDHRLLSLNLRMLDPEVERVLVDGPFETLLRGFDDYLFRAGFTIELEEHNLAHSALRLSNRKVDRVDVRVGIVVVASQHQLLGRATVADLGEPEDILDLPDDCGDCVGDGINRQLRLQRHERVDLLVGAPARLERLDEAIRKPGDPAGTTHDCGHVLGHFRFLLVLVRPSLCTMQSPRLACCWLQLPTYFRLNRLKAVTNMQVDRY